MSQVELATRLNDLGVSFRQQTIAKIEQGLRPLKLEEALLIGKALDVEDQSVWDWDVSIDTQVALKSALQEVMVAKAKVQTVVVELEHARENLKDFVRAFHEELSEADRAAVRAALEKDGAELAAGTLAARSRNRRSGDSDG